MVSPGGNGRREYVEGHRQRAYRKRVTEAFVANALPTALSFQTLNSTNGTDKRSRDAQTARKPPRKRKDKGVRLYISTQEAEALARGETPASVSAKATAKLKAPDPLPGQMDLVTELSRIEEGTDPCSPEHTSTRARTPSTSDRPRDCAAGPQPGAFSNVSSETTTASS